MKHPGQHVVVTQPSTHVEDEDGAWMAGIETTSSPLDMPRMDECDPGLTMHSVNSLVLGVCI